MELTVGCHAGVLALQDINRIPINRDQGKLANALQQECARENLAAKVRRMRSVGLM
jgi:hypothetical protein